MSVLRQKLQKASQQYQCHNFKQSLELYEDAINFCYKTDEFSQTIYNLKSTKGSLHCLLGEYDEALETLNSVLRVSPSHYLCLIRRCQIFKKQGKLRRALKDIEQATLYHPDNLQLAAIKIELQSIIQKSKSDCISSDQSSDEEIDEVEQLRFSNLKKIDRKSCSIMVSPINGRASRVTISGDTAFQYTTDEDQKSAKVGKSTFSKESAKEKYVKTFKQILEQDEEKEQTKLKIEVIVKKNQNSRSKSILKNRNTSIMPVNNQPIKMQNKYGGRQSKLIDMIKDIDGKVITSNQSIVGSSRQASTKEVEFRKSISSSQNQALLFPSGKKDSVSGGQRKSCMKKSLFENFNEEIKKKPVQRKSKFDLMHKSGIDGVVIKNRKSMQMDEVKENVEVDSQNNSESGSSYNIYGSNQLILSKELSAQLGLDKAEKQKSKKVKGGPKQSILKNNSLIFSQTKKSDSTTSEPKKAKKSVMFNKSKFATEST